MQLLNSPQFNKWDKSGYTYVRYMLSEKNPLYFNLANIQVHIWNEQKQISQKKKFAIIDTLGKRIGESLDVQSNA